MKSLRNRFSSLLSVTSVLALCACTGSSGDDAVAGDESNLNEASAPRPGSSIHSPSVDPSKMYWGGRSIDLLQKVGYLTPAEAKLALRADGIIASNPANQRIGVDELATLESPEHIGTLFPEERAIIPKLWKVLAIEAAVDISPPAPGGVAPLVVDRYTPRATQLPVTSTSAVALARRIQLTHDSDANPETISGIDVERAYANRSSYLPEEAALFSTLVREIAGGAARLGPETQRLEFPGVNRTVFRDLSPLSLKLVNAPLDKNLKGGSWPLVPLVPRGTGTPELEVASFVELDSTDPELKVIIFDKETGVDLLGSWGSSVTGNLKRVEVWKGGVRVSELDVHSVSTPPQRTRIPFGYSVKVGEKSYPMEFNSGASGAYFNLPQTVSRPQVPSGSYYFAGRAGERLDVFSTGRALLVSDGKVQNCYPKAVLRRDDVNVVTSCVVRDDTDAVVGTVSFSQSGEAPAIASSTLFGGTVLYPL